MIKQALIGLTAAALLAGCGGEDKAQAPAAKAADGTKTVGLVQLVEHPALDAASRGIQDAVKARGLKVTFDVQNAQADQSNLANIAQRFVSQEYPLILPWQRPLRRPWPMPPKHAHRRDGRDGLRSCQARDQQG